MYLRRQRKQTVSFVRWTPPAMWCRLPNQQIAQNISMKCYCYFEKLRIFYGMLFKESSWHCPEKIYPFIGTEHLRMHYRDLLMYFVGKFILLQELLNVRRDMNGFEIKLKHSSIEFCIACKRSKVYVLLNFWYEDL